MCWYYLKIAWRNLLKYRSQSVINVVGLAIGFMAFALAGYWYQWEHRFDTFHPEWKRTYAITTTGASKTSTGADSEMNQLHKSDAQVLVTQPQVEKVCKMWRAGATIALEERQESLYGYQVDSVFFSVFQAVFLEGNVHKIPYNNEYVVLTRSAAMRLFGTVECIGKVLKPEKQSELKVAAVIADYPGNTELIFNMLVLSSEDRLENNRGRSICYVVLKSPQMAASFEKVVSQHKSVAVDPRGMDQPQRWTFNLRTLPELHFTCNQSLSDRFRNITILFWTGFLLLLCALMNNLALFIGQQQYKLKKNIAYVSLGARPIQRFTQYIVQLLLPVLFGYLLGLVLLELIYPLFDDFTTIRAGAETTIAGSIRHMERGRLFAGSALQIVLYLLVYLLLACIPIGYFVRYTADRSQRGSSAWFRRLLIVGQIFVGSLFFIASISMYKQLHFIQNTPKGINFNHVLQIYLGYEAASQTDLKIVKNRLLQLPEVEEATLTVGPLLLPDGEFNDVGLLSIEGRDIEQLRLEMERDNFVYVQENFFDFFEIPIKNGHSFTKGEKSVYIVNETGVKNIGLDNLLDRPVGGSGRIIGIAGNYHYAPMHYPIQTVIFRLLDEEMQKLYSFGYIYVKTTQKDISRIKDVVAEFDRGEVSRNDIFTWMTDIEDSFNHPETTIFLLFSVFALLCIAISSFGIYSLVALSAEQRKKEIAIRKVNGALFKDILRLFLKEYLLLVIIGNVLALPVGNLFVAHWLESYAYHAHIGVTLYMSVFLITCSIVILSVARRVKLASQANAITSIQYE